MAENEPAVGNCPNCGAPIYEITRYASRHTTIFPSDVTPVKETLFTCPCHEWLQKGPETPRDRPNQEPDLDEPEEPVYQRLATVGNIYNGDGTKHTKGERVIFVQLVPEAGKIQHFVKHQIVSINKERRWGAEVIDVVYCKDFSLYDRKAPKDAPPNNIGPGLILVTLDQGIVLSGDEIWGYPRANP